MNFRSKDSPAEPADATPPSPRQFILNLRGTKLPISKMPNFGVLTAYDGFPGALRFICTEMSPRKFIKRLRLLDSKGMISRPDSVLVITTTPGDAIYDPDWEGRVQNAVRVIHVARARGDREAIRKFGHALRTTGARPGPNTKHRTNRETIRILKEVAGGQQVKATVEGNPPYEQLRRFCKEVYDWCWALGFPDLSKDCTDLVKKTLKERCDFDLPSELPLARIAFERGKKLSEPDTYPSY